MPNQARYEVARHTDHYPIYELLDHGTDSSVRICPERGGIVIGARLNGREILYLDKETFYDPDANIRGGIPVLFPICGQLRQGEYEWDGRMYQMRNHGVARNHPWEVEDEQVSENGAEVTLVLQSTPVTLASYPFDFQLRFTCRLNNGVLSIEQAYCNLSNKPMPMTAGFHPYFATEEKDLSYATDAKQYRDYNDETIKPFTGSIDLGRMKESAAFLDASRPEIAFPLSAHTTIRLTYSEQFRYVVLWSVEGKPFVCVEPWTALNEALNDKQGLLDVPPGEALQLEFAIVCVEAKQHTGSRPSSAAQ